MTIAKSNNFIMSQLGDKLLQLTKLRYEMLPLLIKCTQVDENLNMGDPISRIVVCHLLSELVLDKLLNLALAPNGDAVLSASLTYSQKLDIASRTLLEEDWPLLPNFVTGSLRKLNRIRNKMAHELGVTITREEVIDLFMGVDHLMPIDPNTASISMLIYHYTPFIFGNMLPKFETIDEEV